MNQPRRRVFAEPVPIRAEIGAPGLKQWSGYLDDEWDRRLRNRRDRNDTIAKMLDDATIAATLTALDALMRSAKVTIEPNPITADEEAVVFVESALYEMEDSWESTLSEILSMIAYGYSLFEIVYVDRNGTQGRSNDGKTGWLRWAPRAQDTIERWEFDADGRDVLAAVQIAPPNYKTVAIPLDRCIHFKTRNRKQSPEGKSLIRAAYDAWYFKNQIMRIEGIGIERDLSGIPVMKIPGADYVDAGKQTSWLNLIKTIRMDEQTGVLIPSDRDESGNPLYEFTLQSTAGQHQIDTDKVIARYERWILRVLLSDWMALGDQGGGSFALGVSKSELFVQFVQGILDIIADTVTNQAIRPLCEVNGIADDHAPKMTFEQISKSDLGKFSAAIQMLVAAGLVDANDPQVRDVVYKESGLPIPEGGFEAPEPQSTEERDNALIDAALARQTQTAQLPPGQERQPVGEGGQAFTEPVSHNLRERARAIWREALGDDDDLASLLDAKVVEKV
jgi:hypothetical protein